MESGVCVMLGSMEGNGISVCVWCPEEGVGLRVMSCLNGSLCAH